jgi:hypothetical protein
MKRAYPNDGGGFEVVNPIRNMERWVAAMKQIYALSDIYGWNTAWLDTTKDWDVMEKLDFKQWMKFYQENDHLKYKSAQFAPKVNYFSSGGGSVPADVLRSSLPQRLPDVNFIVPMVQQTEADRQASVMKKIQSIIGRLNAAEKLATLPEVQLALRPLLEMGVKEWIATLQQLKREIQTVPMRSHLTAYDLVHRQANRLTKQGAPKAAEILVKWAQMAAPISSANTSSGVASMNPIDVPMAQQPYDISDTEAPHVGIPGENVLPAPVPSSMSNSTDTSAPPAEVPSSDPNNNETVKEFLRLLDNPSGEEEEDKMEADDEILVSEEDLIGFQRHAQIAPEMTPATPEMAQPVSPEGLAPEALAPDAVAPMADPLTDPNAETAIEVSEEDPTILPDESTSPIATDEDPFDAVLQNVTTKDLITRLERISNFFKKREITKELAIVDLMMDKLGFISFFPSLAEINKSTLDNINYCNSRTDDILSKLRGSFSESAGTDFSGNSEKIHSPEALQVQQNLSQEQEIEKARKERRKQKAIEEDLKSATPPAAEQVA